MKRTNKIRFKSTKMSTPRMQYERFMSGEHYGFGGYEEYFRRANQRWAEEHLWGSKEIQDDN